MKYHEKHSSGLQEVIVKFIKTKQYHSRVPLNENWDLCLMEGKCIYQVKDSFTGNKLCKVV